MPERLAAHGVDVAYGGAITALTGVSIDVEPGQIVAVLGGNGAGKTTLLRTLSGLLALHGGRLNAGAITLDGSDIATMPADRRVSAGIVQVIEGRRVFATLTTRENLMVGGHAVRRRELATRIDEMVQRFSLLAPLLDRPAGLLSGGEQQMLAICRALLSQPRYLLLDEPSLGLAPLIVERVAETIVELARDGLGVVLVEQNARLALGIASHATVLRNGTVGASGEAATLAERADIQSLYLGGAGGEEFAAIRNGAPV